MINFVSVILVAVTVAAAILLRRSEATVYRVGDSAGWTVPNGYSYNSWAAQHTFMAGDVLEFDFNTGQHSVAVVPLDDFNNCNTFKALNVQTIGPANVTLAPGQSYFICTEDNHCLLGQKLAVNVSNYPQPGFGSPYGYGPPYAYGSPYGYSAPCYGYRNTATIAAATAAPPLLLLSIALAFLF